MTEYLNGLKAIEATLSISPDDNCWVPINGQVLDASDC
jgi:hypothetical protein